MVSMRTCSGSSMRSQATRSIRSRSPSRSTGVGWALSSTPMISTPPSMANCARSRASSLFAPLPEGSSRLKSRVCRSVRISWLSASRSSSSLVGSHSITWSSSCDVGCLAAKGAVDGLGRVDDGCGAVASSSRSSTSPWTASVELFGRELAVQLLDGGPDGVGKRAQVDALLGNGDVALPGTVALPAGDVAGGAVHADGVVGHSGAPCVDGGRDDVGDLLGGDGQRGGGHLASVWCFPLELQDKVQQPVADPFQHPHDLDPGAAPARLACSSCREAVGAVARRWRPTATEGGA